jgi:hypothetical protein
METRPFFVLGDIFTNVAAGVAAALLTWSLVPLSWSPLLSMPAGMILGTLAAIPVTIALSPLFGAFEIMLPGMLSGMIAGMIAAMMSATESPGMARAAAWGAGAGIAVVIWVYALTAYASRSDRHGPQERT